MNGAVHAAIETDPETVATRMHSAQLASIAFFVLLALALALSVRALGLRAKRQEDDERLASAFQEIERELQEKK